ncbi:hypothetical protein V8C34DRAFT_88459 [Trichoderma compactum]
MIRAPVGFKTTAPSMCVDPGECGCRTPCIAGTRPASAWTARRHRHVSFSNHVMSVHASVSLGLSIKGVSVEAGKGLTACTTHHRWTLAIGTRLLAAFVLQGRPIRPVTRAGVECPSVRLGTCSTTSLSVNKDMDYLCLRWVAR